MAKGTNSSPNYEYVRILQIVFSIIVAVGLVQLIPKALPPLDANHIYYYLLKLLPITLALIIVLVRFFFIPSLNIKELIDHKKVNRLVIFFDVPAVIFQALLFALICYLVGQANQSNSPDYRTPLAFFSGLLIVNVLSIMAISMRIGWQYHHKVRSINNSIHALIGVAVVALACCFPVSCLYWIFVLIIFSNSFFDLFFTWKSYLVPSK